MTIEIEIDNVSVLKEYSLPKTTTEILIGLRVVCVVEGGKLCSTCVLDILTIFTLCFYAQQLTPARKASDT